MAVTSLEVPFRADLGRWSRWQWRIPRWALPVAMALVLIGVLATAAARIDYAVNYQPLTFDGGAFGPVTGLTSVSDGFATTRWLLTAKPGTTGTFSYAITNSGSDPVTIYDVPQSRADWLYTSQAWAPAMDFTDSNKLPVVIPPHKAIQLLFSIRKPVCPSGGGTEIFGLTVRYRAFGFNRVVTLPLSGNLAQPIEVCFDPR